MLLTDCSCRATAGSIATATVRRRSCSQALRHGLVLEEPLTLHVHHSFHCFLVDHNETGNVLLDVLRENMHRPGVRKDLSCHQDVILLTHDTQ